MVRHAQVRTRGGAVLDVGLTLLGKCTCNDSGYGNMGVNRGCHDPPCGTGAVDGAPERAGNFDKVLSTLKS